ncbi:MAG: NAD(P)-binding domain-containing protein [Acidimicrobiia bacterium]
MTRVAFLGVGRMGTPMAGRHSLAGHELVVWSRTRAHAEALATGPRWPPARQVACDGEAAILAGELSLSGRGRRRGPEARLVLVGSGTGPTTDPLCPASGQINGASAICTTSSARIPLSTHASPGHRRSL